MFFLGLSILGAAQITYFCKSGIFIQWKKSKNWKSLESLKIVSGARNLLKGLENLYHLMA